AFGANATVQKLFTLRVGTPPAQPLSIGGTTISDTLIGNTTAFGLFALGGAPPYSFSIVAGSLPTGTVLAPNGETLSSGFGPGLAYLAGRAMATGSYSFTVQVTDGLGTVATKSFTWRIVQLSFQNLQFTALAALQRNIPFSRPLLVVGGTGIYNWTAMGMLPSGILLDPSGVVHGSPVDTGGYATAIQVMDS